MGLARVYRKDDERPYWNKHFNWFGSTWRYRDALVAPWFDVSAICQQHDLRGSSFHGPNLSQSSTVHQSTRRVSVATEAFIILKYLKIPWLSLAIDINRSLSDDSLLLIDLRHFGWSNCTSKCQDGEHETRGSELVERQWKKNIWCRIDLAYPCVGRWDRSFSKLVPRANQHAVAIWMMIWMCLTRQQNLRA